MGAWAKRRHGDAANGRVGDMAIWRMVGRKSRRAHDGPFRIRLGAPDLRPRRGHTTPMARSAPRIRQPGWHAAPPTAQIRRDSASKVVAVVRAEIFALPIAHSPHRSIAETPFRLFAVTRVNLSFAICHAGASLRRARLSLLAPAGSELLPDSRDQEAVLVANHLRPKITDAAGGLSPVTQRKRDFESDFILVAPVRDIDHGT